MKRRQRHLLDRLRRSVSRQPHDVGEGMDKVVFGVAATATIAFVVWGFISPHGLGRVSKWALGGTISNFGWLFVLSSTLFVVFVVFVAASWFGKIPPGRGRRGARVLHRLLGLHDVRHGNGYRTDFLRGR